MKYRALDRAKRRAAYTRGVYEIDTLLSWGTPTLPMATLRRLGQRIWREKSPWKARCPEIIAGRGMRWHGQWLSYCQGRNLIVLCRNQRNRVVLIHEMSHALTNWLHGPGFQNKYAELLKEYL